MCQSGQNVEHDVRARQPFLIFEHAESLNDGPIWHIIDRAVDVFVQNLPEPERTRLGDIAERLVRGDWPVTSHWEPTRSALKLAQRRNNDKARPTRNTRS